MTDLATERRAIELFEQLLDIDEAERCEWIARQTSGNAVLAKRLSRLIEADNTHMLRTGGAVDEAVLAEPPERIGAYRLGELIGAGGMGAVYAARRDKGDFEHEVAIKLIKPGLFSDRLTERFARERQLLAQFTHPAIARLYDGGETEDGQPYIVMEKVDGIPLDVWLERAGPSGEERLLLFLAVCDAVGHAHRNLVIHRDLSPSNILVTPSGGPKLIDFGIALLDGEELEAQAGGQKRLRHMTLTPGYAAPERVRGEPATTLSDIYSAGRLLNLLVAKPRPPELQSIARKALEADPERRYQSIVQLADDVRRFLDQRPVEAHPAGPAYIVRKWVLRNPALSAVSLATIAAILLGFGGTAWFARQESIARIEANERSDDLRKISRTMMFELYDELENVDGTAETRARLAQTAQTYIEQLANQSNAPEIQLEAGLGYFRLAEVVGGRRGGGSLGRLAEAKLYYGRSREILERLYAQHPERRDVMSALAQVLAVTADATLFNDGDYSTAESDALAARKLIERIGPNEPALAAALAAAYVNLGNALAWRAEPEAAGAEYAAGLERLTRMPEAIQRDPAVLTAKAELLRMTGAFHSYFRRPDDALSALQTAVKLHREVSMGADNPTHAAVGLARALDMLAAVEIATGHTRSAQRHLAEALDITRAGIARNAGDFGLRQVFVKIAIRQARLFASVGDRSSARELVEAAVATRRELSREAGGVISSQVGLAVDLQQASQVLVDSNERHRACALMREAMAIFRRYEETAELPAANIEVNLKPLINDLRAC